MKRMLSQFVLLAAASFFLPLAAHALQFRTYVSSSGSDANGCGVTAPCRLLPAALAQTVDGGEIWMLDSANFNSGTVIVNKSVTIQAIPGQVGSIVSVGGSAAISVSPGISLTLRNVSITNNANNPGTDGIDMTTGVLSVESSLIVTRGYGILVTGAGQVSVHDSVVKGITGSSIGINATGGSNVDVSRSKFYNCGYACIQAIADTAGVTTELNVHDSEFANFYVGIYVLGGNATGVARAMVSSSSLSNGFAGSGSATASYGIVSQANIAGTSVVVSVGYTKIIGQGSGMGVFGSGAVIESLGNNLVRGNVANTVNSITPVSGT